jgi:hypothetical protein
VEEPKAADGHAEGVIGERELEQGAGRHDGQLG